MIDYQNILNKNLLNVFVEILKEIEKSGLNGDNHLYITFATNNPNTLIPEWLLQKYPNKMTIVIQHEYYNLSINKNDFNIGLSFNNKKCNLKICFESIISFADPVASFGLNYQSNRESKNKYKKIKKKKDESFKNNEKIQNSSNVLNFSNYKKN